MSDVVVEANQLIFDDHGLGGSYDGDTNELMAHLVFVDSETDFEGYEDISGRRTMHIDPFIELHVN